MSDVDPTDGGIHSGDPNSGSSLPGADVLRGWGFKWIQSLIQQIVKAIVGVLLPGDAFTQLQNWAQVLLPAQIFQPVQSLIDLILNGFDGDTQNGNPIELIITRFTDLFGLLSTLTNGIGEARDFAEQAFNAVVQIVQDLDDPPAYDFWGDLVDAFMFWTVGWWDFTKKAHTTDNAAITSSNNRIAALEAVAAGGAGGFDDFNGSSLDLTKWDSIPVGGNKLNVSSGIVQASDTRRTGKWLLSRPGTGHYRVQAAVVDFHNGISRIIAASNSGYTSMCALDINPNSFGWDFTLGKSTGHGNSIASGSSTAHMSPGSVRAGDVLVIEADEVTDPSNPIYRMFINDTQLGSDFVDTGNTIGITGTDAHRYMGLVTDRGNVSTGSGAGPGFDVFSFADIP